MALIFCSQISKAQVNLEYTFTGVVRLSDDSYISRDGYSGGFVSFDNPNRKIYIYNLDYSLNKLISYVLPTGYQLNKYPVVSYLTKKLFNDDEKIEYLVSFYYSDKGYQRMALILYNEDGDILKDFGNAGSLEFNAHKMSDNKDILSVIRGYNYNQNLILTDWYTQIYSLRGAITDISSVLESKSINRPFPNPANQIINIPYKLISGESSFMKVMDIQGRLVEQIQIDTKSEKVLLNVSDYQNGIYFYVIDGVRSKFVVKH